MRCARAEAIQRFRAHCAYFTACLHVTMLYAKTSQRSLVHLDMDRNHLSTTMGRLGYAYVVIQAFLSRFVISASTPASFEIMSSPLIGSGNVSNSTYSDTTIFSNMTTQSISINDTGTDNTGLRISCNGQKFGSPLDLPSCLGTISIIRAYDKESTFGMRTSGEEGINCPLPFRWLNSRFPSFDLKNPIQIPYLLSHPLPAISADGLCKVQIFLIAPATIAHASTSQIKAAALAIYDQCGAGRTPSKGGVASNIGTHRF